jgi:hypothetical protein
MISEGVEVPARYWKIGLASTEAKAYEAPAENAEPRLEVRPALDPVQDREGLPA